MQRSNLFESHWSYQWLTLTIVNDPTDDHQDDERRGPREIRDSQRGGEAAAPVCGYLVRLGTTKALTVDVIRMVPERFSER